MTKLAITSALLHSSGGCKATKNCLHAKSGARSVETELKKLRIQTIRCCWPVAHCATNKHSLRAPTACMLGAVQGPWKTEPKKLEFKSIRCCWPVAHCATNKHSFTAACLAVEGAAALAGWRITRRIARLIRSHTGAFSNPTLTSAAAWCCERDIAIDAMLHNRLGDASWGYLLGRRGTFLNSIITDASWAQWKMQFLPPCL